MDDLYNLALQDLSQALFNAQKVLDGEEVFCDETDAYIRTLSLAELEDELKAITLCTHPLLYEINNETDPDFVKARNRARKDWQQWHLFVENYIPKDE